MMKKIIVCFALFIIVLSLSACSDDFTGTEGMMGYAALIELLEQNGFTIEPVEQETEADFLSAIPRRFYIDGELITIYEYSSNQAMETEAGFVSADGFSINNENSGVSVAISWVSNPYWFKRDLIIVNYVGTNGRIIDFLMEALDFFAGHGFPSVYGGAYQPYLSQQVNMQVASNPSFIIEKYGSGADQALELIYADDLYRYHLPSISSHLITLVFDDGQRIPLLDAISQGISIDDLISGGLHVIRENTLNGTFVNVSRYEIGRVWLASGDIEHEPGEHFLHGAMNTENGLLSASGIPFEFWLADNLDNLPEIQFVPGMQLMVDGKFGRIITFPQEHPESSPSLYISVGAEGTELHRIRAAQGTTSWFPAFAFMDRIPDRRHRSGLWLEASGEHPLDFWSETWECIDFNAFRADVGSGSNNIEVRLDFGFPPTSLSVRRWSTEFIGMASEMWNTYEVIEVTGNVFFIHNDGSDYIYEVVASWAHGEHSFGNASYTFRLNAAS